MIGIIAAVSENGIIGVNNNIPWIGKYPEDLKRFKKLTINSNIIMGSKTWKSIGEKPLPNRNNIIISSKLNIETDQVSVTNSVHNAIRMCSYLNNDPIWIIGGESIYQQSINLIDFIDLTIIPEYIQVGLNDNVTKFPWINPLLFKVNSIENLNNNIKIINYTKNLHKFS
jgi:dihydrofolate reductase